MSHSPPWRRLLALAVVALLAAGCVPAAKGARQAPARPAPTEAEREQALRLFQKAQDQQRRGKLAAAIETYRRLIAAYPHSALADDALFWTGRIQFDQEAVGPAAASLKRILEEYPDSDLLDEARFWYGRLALAQGRAAEAVTLFEDLAGSAADPLRAAQIAEYLAEAYLAQGKLARGVRWLLTAQAGHEPGSPEANRLQEQIEESVLTGKDMAELDALVNRFEKAHPGDLARYRRMELYLEREDLTRAQQEALLFLGFFPGHPFESLARERLRVIEGAREVDPRRVGVLLPLSGPYRIFGERALRGIEMALNTESFKGARAGKAAPITVVIRDTQGNPTLAAKAVEELVFDERVVAIVGPLLGITAEPAARRAQQLGVPIVTLSQREGIPEIGPYVFRYFMTPRDQVRTIVSYATRVRGLRTFAVLYPESPLGRDFLQQFWREVERQGGWVVAADSYPEGSTDFKAPLSRMTRRYYPDARGYEEQVRARSAGPDWDPLAIAKIEYAYWKRFRAPPGPEEGGEAATPAARPPADAPPWPPKEPEDPPPVLAFDAIFIPDTYERVTLIAPQLDYNDILGADMLGIAAWNDPKLAELGEKYVDGAVFVDGFFARSSSERVRRFVASYQELFDEPPGLLDATAYDAATLLGRLLAGGGGGLLRSQVREQLLGLQHLPLVLGEVSFSPEGEAQIPLTLLTVAKRHITEVRLSGAPSDEPASGPSESP